MITKTEVKALCQLVKAYTRDEITKEEFWSKRAKFFPQQDLFEGVK